MSTQAMPEPHWRGRGKHRTPRKAPLTIERIVTAALAILDAEGTGAVTMRRVAADLGTGPASLYAHVSDRDELLRLCHDRVLEEVVLPDLDGLSWQESVRTYAIATYEVYQRHADIARMSFADIPTGPIVLDTVESFLARLLKAGLPARVATLAVDTVALYLASTAFEGWCYQQRFREPEVAWSGAGVEWIGGVREFFGALPRDRYPTIVGNVDVMMGADDRERFEFGLDLIIRGMASYDDPGSAD